MKNRIKQLYYDGQLWLDLAVIIESPRVKRRGRKTGAKNKKRAEPNDFHWSQNDLDKIIDGFFLKSLETLLHAKTNSAERADVYEWTFKPLVNVYQGHKPETLSFQFCCLWLGYEPDEVQERILNVLNRDGLIKPKQTKLQAIAA